MADPHPLFVPDHGADTRPTLGLIVLQVDETIEDEFRRMLPPALARLHVTRIPSGADLTPDTIATMADALPASAALLPSAAKFASVGYGCTSAATLLGPERVAALVRDGLDCDGLDCATVTDPLTAARAGFDALGLRRVGLVTPYIASVADPMRHSFEASGVAVPHALSFDECSEAAVARIPAARLRSGAHSIAASGGIDGLFLSCTNLRTLDLIPDLEAELGMPVLSSNRVLAWDMARAAGIAIADPWAF